MSFHPEVVEEEEEMGEATIEFDSPKVAVCEGVGQVGIAITKSGKSGASVKWRTKETESRSPAVDGVDFKAKSGTLVFEPGDYAREIFIPIMDEATTLQCTVNHNPVMDEATTLQCTVNHNPVMDEAALLVLSRCPCIRRF